MVAQANYASMDDLIRGRSGEATDLLQQGVNDANNISRQGFIDNKQYLQQYMGMGAINERNALLGLDGDQAQQQALGGIQVSDFDKELNRRQSETLNRTAYASGDVSGASLLGAQELGGRQQSNILQGRLNELNPLISTSLGARSALSSAGERLVNGMTNRNFNLGAQQANIRSGGSAPLIQGTLDRAELSGLQGISRANQRGQVAGQLSNLAGQYFNSGTNQPSSYSQPVINYNAGSSNPNYSPASQYSPINQSYSNPNYSPVSQPQF